jgi:hypothetical protein
MIDASHPRAWFHPTLVVVVVVVVWARDRVGRSKRHAGSRTHYRQLQFHWNKSRVYQKPSISLTLLCAKMANWILVRSTYDYVAFWFVLPSFSMIL